MNSKSAILELYPWIDSEFVKKLLNKSDNDEACTVESFNVEKGARDGQNFSSNTIRLIVNLSQTNNQSNNLSNKRRRVYFLKICLQTEDFLKACEECFYYEKEIEAYNEIIPAVEALLLSIEFPTQLAPRSI